MANQPETPADALLPSSGGQEPIFTDQPSLALCSYNQCLAGHIWPITLAVAPCPGCKSPVLAIKRENCPICNEPVVHASIRSDNVPRGAGVSERCLGKLGLAETLDIVLDRSQQVKQAEEGMKNFEERCKAEDAKIPQILKSK